MVWIEAEHCKTVGSAYVGSNPTPDTTPATTCENGPLAAETQPGGPFSSRHAMYQGASPWVDAWQCARTYGVQRPGKTSGACNRSLCPSTPVLSGYPGTRTARLTGACPCIAVGRFFAVLLALGSGLVLFVPGPESGACTAGDPIEPCDGKRAAPGCPSPPGWETGMAVWRAALRARTSCSGVPGVPGVPGQGLNPVEPDMYLSWTGGVPVIYPPYTCGGDSPDHEPAVPAWLL